MILTAVKNGSFFGLLEVDLRTPSWLKEQCNKINFAVIFDKIEIKRDMLNGRMQNLCDKKGMKFPTKPQLSLVYDTDNYLITSTMLQFYMNLGLQVTNLHYCIEYQRANPLKKFIEKSMFIC